MRRTEKITEPSIISWQVALCMIMENTSLIIMPEGSAWLNSVGGCCSLIRTILRHTNVSTLVQVVVYWLTTPSYYLNQIRLIISQIILLRASSWPDLKTLINQTRFENIFLKSHPDLPGPMCKNAVEIKRELLWWCQISRMALMNLQVVHVTLPSNL